MFRLGTEGYVQLTPSYGDPGIADLAEWNVASTGLHRGGQTRVLTLSTTGCKVISYNIRDW